jgi:hypothetical protein
MSPERFVKGESERTQKGRDGADFASSDACPINPAGWKPQDGRPPEGRDPEFVMDPGPCKIDL